MIASFYCVNTQNPGRNKIDSHISNIFAEKKTNKNTSDKVVKNKAENEMKSELEQVHTKKRRKENETIPQTTKQTFIVLCIDNRISQATNH